MEKRIAANSKKADLRIFEGGTISPLPLNLRAKYIPLLYSLDGLRSRFACHLSPQVFYFPTLYKVRMFENRKISFQGKYLELPIWTCYTYCAPEKAQ